jgi:hypothetical protein
VLRPLLRAFRATQPLLALFQSHLQRLRRSQAAAGGLPRVLLQAGCRVCCCSSEQAHRLLRVVQPASWLLVGRQLLCLPLSLQVPLCQLQRVEAIGILPVHKAAVVWPTGSGGQQLCHAGGVTPQGGLVQCRAATLVFGGERGACAEQRCHAARAACGRRCVQRRQALAVRGVPLSSCRQEELQAPQACSPRRKAQGCPAEVVPWTQRSRINTARAQQHRKPSGVAPPRRPVQCAGARAAAATGKSVRIGNAAAPT